MLVAGADNSVETRQIVASRAIGDKWLVTDGLKAGDRVVVSGRKKYVPGAQVKSAGNYRDNKQQAASGDQPSSARVLT